MSTSSSGLSSFQVIMGRPQPQSNLSSTSTQQPQLNQGKKFPYQAAQQVKFLHLEAEVESLLQQLKNLKQQRTVSLGAETRE